jgi:hypothetical protein
LALRFANFDALWFDELMQFYFVGGAQYGPILSLSDFFVRIINVDRWPPLYHLLVSAWGQLTAWDAFSVRALSAGFGVIVLALVIRLGSDFHSRRMGALAALLLGSSAFFIYFMHELRAYTFYPMLLLLALLCYWRASRAPSVKPVLALALVLTVVAALYTHPTSYFFMTALGLYHLLAQRRRPTYTPILILLAICALLAAPWVWIMIWKALVQDVDIGETGAGVVVRGFLSGFGNGVLWPLFVVGMGVALWRVRGQAATLFWSVLGGTLAITLALDAVAPFLFHMRHILVLQPLLMLALAWGATLAAQARPRLVAVLVGCGCWSGYGTCSTAAICSVSRGKSRRSLAM